MMAKTAMANTIGPNLQCVSNVSIHEPVGMNIFMGFYHYETYLQITVIRMLWL